jgi:hypothetical protein
MSFDRDKHASYQNSGSPRGKWVGAALGIPTLSSAQSSWRGALLERHIHGPCVSCTEWLSCNWPHCEIGEMKVKGIDEQHEYK